MKTNHQYLITGATSALGVAISNRIIESFKGECKLIMISRSRNEQLQFLVDDGVRYYSGIDLLTFQEQENVISDIEDFFNGPFTLIHSAGDFWLHLPFLEVPSQTGRAMMDSHYGTFYSVLQGILPVLISKGGGQILTFSCNATEYHFPNMLPFTAAKAAVDAAIKCIAHEYANRNIVANSIALSSLKTPQNKESKPFGDFENYLDLKELSDTVIEIAELSTKLSNGNVINCYNYSDSYYHDGYFTRIRQMK